MPLEPPIVGQRCGRCGYATAGNAHRTCPECGFDCTQPAYLRYADRGWLRMVVIGTWLLEIGGIGLLATQFGGAWIARTIISFSGTGLISPTVLRATLSGAFLACAVIGAWLLTTPDPGYMAEGDERARRRSLERVGVAVAGLLGAVRLFGTGVIPALPAALITLAAITCGLYLAVRLTDRMRELLARSEATPLNRLAKPRASTAWIFWCIGALTVVLAFSARGGLTGFAAKLESTLLGLGVIIVGVTLLKLVEGAKAIRQELDRVL